ncbi:MAG: Cro/Cl family transcriptional regulator [Burkholderiales bacterium]
MDSLLKFINDLSPVERKAFCTRCNTTEGYLRKAISTGQRLGESLSINIERETNRVITCETLRPDVDWDYLRQTCKDAA